MILKLACREQREKRYAEEKTKALYVLRGHWIISGIFLLEKIIRRRTYKVMYNLTYMWNLELELIKIV